MGSDKNISEFDRKTGELFEQLWGSYDEELFEESVDLFRRRLDLIGFDPTFFQGKVVLDAGCGGGRNTIAIARLGAKSAHGIDVGVKGIEDAQRRGRGLANVSFSQGSIEAIPFPDASFDAIWCAGVLMHAEHEDQALDELARVLKPNGLLYLLVYATGGMRWPLIQLIKPLAAAIGQADMERAVVASGLPANKRRTFLDDLFVPKFDFFHWDRLVAMLKRRGFKDIRRWSAEARLDHEHNLASYREDISSLTALLAAGCAAQFGEKRALFEVAHALTENTVRAIRHFELEVDAGRLEMSRAMDIVIGQGHHRVLATKES